MFLRKLYLKSRLYLQIHKRKINSAIMLSMILFLLYLFVDNIVFNNFIMGMASSEMQSRDYAKAVKYYEIGEKYYSLNHFSKENKEIYMEIPFRKATCYWINKQKKESIQSMQKGVSSIQQQYGIFSHETAYFIRKYLIEFYLNCGYPKLATQEFNNLVAIYKNIDYDDNELADLVRLSGDLYYQRQQYDAAIDLYEQAYQSLYKYSTIDYEVSTKVITRIINYQIQKGMIDKASDLYKNLVSTLKTSGKKQSSLTAETLFKYGDFLASKNDFNGATQSYEEAWAIIKKLPRSNYYRRNLNTYLLILKDYYNAAGQYHKSNEIDLELARRRRFPLLSS